MDYEWSCSTCERYKSGLLVYSPSLNTIWYVFIPDGKIPEEFPVFSRKYSRRLVQARVGVKGTGKNREVQKEQEWITDDEYWLNMKCELTFVCSSRLSKGVQHIASSVFSEPQLDSICTWQLKKDHSLLHSSQILVSSNMGLGWTYTVQIPIS